MIYIQPCTKTDRLRPPTLLAMLPSLEDTSRAIVKNTGEVIDISQVPSSIIQKNINDKIWVYYELSKPRQILLLNPNWIINSFDPSTKLVCVTLVNNVSTVYLNFTLRPLN
jgi:hypothetical protein